MNILGPLGAGVVYDHVMMGAPYWTGALILVASAYLLAQTAARPAHTEHAPLVKERAFD